MNGSVSVTSLNEWVLLILLRLTPANSYFLIGVPIGYVLAFVPLTILPPTVLPVTFVYSITSSPINTYPVLVVPIPTPSKVPKVEESATTIPSVESELYSAVIVVGTVSGVTFERITELFEKYIPWFLWFTLKCNPSVSTLIEEIWVFPPLE